MRRARFTCLRPVLLSLGVLTAAVAVTAVSAPAYARPAPASAAQPAASSQATPSPGAPVSGHHVAGAVYGAAAATGNGIAAADFLKLHRQMVANSHGTATRPNAQLHAWWGSFPGTNSGNGVMATQTLAPSLRLSHAADILYAPTMTGANNDCIEVVTVHTTRQPQIWAWDWCNLIAPGAKVNVNQAFLKAYATNVNGRKAYTTEEVQTSKTTNSWTAYLYNYQTKAWDSLFTSAGTDQSGLSYGWDMFEFYSATNPGTGNTYVCGDLQNVGTTAESSSLQIRSGSTWQLANSGDSMWSPEAHPNPADYNCPDMKFHIVKNNYDWTVRVTAG